MATFLGLRRLPRPLRLFVLTLAAVTCACAGVPRPSQSGGGELPAPLDATLHEAMKRSVIPGLSYAVVVDGKLRWSGGIGAADLENDVPATERTVYRLASVSKTLTAVTAMSLFEDGKLDLDAAVQRYVPSFPEKAWPLTPRELLGHLGGVRHYRDGEIESTRHYANVIDGLAIFAGDPLLFEPGTKFNYSSYGFNLLGAVLEGASGLPYPQVVHDRVLAKAAMSETRPDDVGAVIPHRAAGYVRKNGAYQNSGLADTSYKLPSGGWVSTAPDMARFAVALFDDRLLRPDTRALMFTEQKTRSGSGTGYALGWGVWTHQGVRVAAHSGGQQRVSTLIYLEPERRFAVILLCNLEDVDLAATAMRLADQLREVHAGQQAAR
jgi:serine beta-lactamase-like protein LACTB, mitochondrial